MKGAWALTLAGFAAHAAAPLVVESETLAVTLFLTGLAVCAAGLAVLARAKGRPAWHAAVGLCPVLGPLVGIILIGFIRYEDRAGRDARTVFLSRLKGAGIVLLLLGFLAALFLRRPREEATLKDLAVLRERLSAIHGPEGEPPPDLAKLGVLPATRLGDVHGDSAALRLAAEPDDKGGWLYAPAAQEDASLGLRVNCTHTDPRGNVWASY